jgi:hypothetical protein
MAKREGLGAEGPGLVVARGGLAGEALWCGRKAFSLATAVKGRAPGGAGLAGLSGGDVGRGFGLAAVARGHGFAEGFEAGALAEDLGQRVAVEGGAHDVAAEGHFGVVGLADELAQAVEARAQQIDGGEVLGGFGQIEGGREDLAVLVEDDEGLAAEGFGLVAHLDEAAPVGDRQFDEAGEFFFEGGEGGIDGVDVGLGEVEGYEVLAHAAVFSGPVVDGVAPKGIGASRILGHKTPYEYPR